jgi:hypothetical protein
VRVRCRANRWTRIGIVRVERDQQNRDSEIGDAFIGIGTLPRPKARNAKRVKSFNNLDRESLDCELLAITQVGNRRMVGMHDGFQGRSHD